MDPSRASYYFFKKKEREGGRQAGQVRTKMCYMKLNRSFHQRLFVFNMLKYSVNLKDKGGKQSAI